MVESGKVRTSTSKDEFKVEVVIAPIRRTRHATLIRRRSISTFQECVSPRDSTPVRYWSSVEMWKAGAVIFWGGVKYDDVDAVECGARAFDEEVHLELVLLQHVQHLRVRIHVLLLLALQRHAISKIIRLSKKIVICDTTDEIKKCTFFSLGGER